MYAGRERTGHGTSLIRIDHELSHGLIPKHMTVLLRFCARWVPLLSALLQVTRSSWSSNTYTRGGAPGKR